MLVYIITDEEEKAFKSLSNEEERENFKEELLAAPQSEPGLP